MVRIILFILFIFFPLNLSSTELTNQEKIFYNLIDINNDGIISIDEIKQSMEIIFQLIDVNKDGNLSEYEIIELKNIIELLS